MGKSTLMSKMTGTFSEVGAYEFTTLTTVPGMLQYKGAKIQVNTNAQRIEVYYYSYLNMMRLGLDS